MTQNVTQFIDFKKDPRIPVFCGSVLKLTEISIKIQSCTDMEDYYRVKYTCLDIYKTTVHLDQNIHFRVPFYKKLKFPPSRLYDKYPS